MKNVTIEYPDELELAISATDRNWPANASLMLAYQLYAVGRLTSGQAAQFAGISRVVFLLGCSSHHVSSVEWDEQELIIEEKSLTLLE